MKYRSIRKKMNAMPVDMGGFLVYQSLPLQNVEQIDPFLLVHHADHMYKGGKQEGEEGVPPHPHRGFSPVTFIFKGGLHHRDSEDNSAIVYEGGTQWMHAGSGIIHSERPPKKTAEEGGPMEIIQFWVNTPSKHKFEAPYYHPLDNDKTPEIQNEGVSIKVVCGEFEDKQGPVKTFSPMLALRMEFEAGGKHDFKIPENYNVFVYLLNGKLCVNDNEVEAADKDLVWFANDGAGFQIKAEEKSRFIILAGAPINEPIVSYGPFVMNTQEEIMQAMQDYQTGKMGVLNEKFG